MNIKYFSILLVVASSVYAMDENRLLLNQDINNNTVIEMVKDQIKLVKPDSIKNIDIERIKKQIGDTPSWWQKNKKYASLGTVNLLRFACSVFSFVYIVKSLSEKCKGECLGSTFLSCGLMLGLFFNEGVSIWAQLKMFGIPHKDSKALVIYFITMLLAAGIAIPAGFLI